MNYQSSIQGTLKTRDIGAGEMPVPAPRSMPVILSELELLDEQVTQLTTTAGHLIEQLGPITVSTPEKDGAAEADGTECSPVTARIRQIGRRVRYIRQILSQARDTIEI